MNLSPFWPIQLLHQCCCKASVLKQDQTLPRSEHQRCQMVCHFYIESAGRKHLFLCRHPVLRNSPCHQTQCFVISKAIQLFHGLLFVGLKMPKNPCERLQQKGLQSLFLTNEQILLFGRHPSILEEQKYDEWLYISGQLWWSFHEQLLLRKLQTPVCLVLLFFLE